MSVKYKVWAFRKFSGCYECDNIQRLETCPMSKPIELTGEQFTALERSVRSNYGSDFVYLYQVDGEDEALVEATVTTLIEAGQKAIQDELDRAAIRQRKQKEKKAKDKLTAERDSLAAANREREEYEKLKAKYGT